MEERINGIDEVVGSSPTSSTLFINSSEKFQTQNPLPIAHSVAGYSLLN
jgi:hypothetical protein